MSDDSQAAPRIAYDDVEFDDQLALVDGRPFSGVIFGLHSDGSLQGETRYRDGLPEGLSEDWYADGTLARRSIAVRGKGSSESWYWHPNGQLKSYRRNVDMLPVELMDWDENGTPVSGEDHPPSSFAP